MSSRGLSNKLGRGSVRSWMLLALFSILLIAAGATGLQRVVASFPKTTAPANYSALHVRNNLANASEQRSGTVVGIVEGNFNAKTHKLTLINENQKNVRLTYNAFGRADANTQLAEGSYTKAFVRSCAQPSGSVPCVSAAPANTISGELQLNNTGSNTFYNTRLVFTDFLDVKGGIPVTANAFFNDGQVPANGKLGVSLDYGDVLPSDSQTRIWSFYFPSGSISNFYFRYVIYADIGVATESVEPAAVQNNSARTITITGQNFTSPTVTLLDSGGATAATLTVNSSTATSIDATVPSGTTPGIYSVRVTNSGGTPGGPGSSTLIGRLTVTTPPDGPHTGVFSSFTDAGPYSITANSTISGTVPAGTVVYVNDGVSLMVGTGLNADGGIPGVPTTSPMQIVFTRAPGGSSWGGLNATGATGDVVLKNGVVEFGGTLGNGQVDMTGSGRQLTFTDSISRRGAGHGLKASGTGDKFTGFTRSRVENNAGAAVYLSANAALGGGAGMSSLNTANANTRVPDQGYYFSAADVIRGNGTDAIQIDATNNDFTMSGVLVGMGAIPIQILGSGANPSVVGGSGSPAELALNPGLLLQLAAGMDLKAGDGNLEGGISANGWAGVSQSPSGNAALSRRITFDKIPGGGNFGSIFFSTTATASSILNFVTVMNGGGTSLGQGQVIIDQISFAFSLTNSFLNSSSKYGVQYRGDLTIDLTGTTYSSNSLGNEFVIPILSTIAGGTYGDGNQANKASIYRPIAFAVDAGRGIYFVDEINSLPMIRFFNTTSSPVKVAGITVPAKALKNISAGQYFGNETPSDSPVDTVDFYTTTSMALSPDKKVLYTTQVGAATQKVFGLNVSPGSASGANTATTIGGVNVKVGNMGTVYDDMVGSLSTSLKGMTTSPTTGDIYLCDSGNYRLYKLTTGGVLTPFAGTGARPPGLFSWKAFPEPLAGSSASATAFYLYDPEGVTVSSDGATVYVADARYARVVRIQAGTARLVTQLGNFDAAAKFDTTTNPLPVGLTTYGGSLYITNANAQTLLRIDSPSTVSALASPLNGDPTIQTPVQNLIGGTENVPCDYTSTSCGDAGSGTVGFSMQNLYGNLSADANGIILVDQYYTARGRIRYRNLSGATTTVAGVSIPNGIINTIGGHGLPLPFNGALATSAVFESSPAGLAIDPSNNVWVTEANIGNGGSPLKFINRSGSTINMLGQTVVAGGMIRINHLAADPTTDESTDPSTAYFYTLQGLAATGEGIYIVDSNGKSVPAMLGRKTSRLRFINTTASPVTFYSGSGTPITVPSGEIRTIAGGSVDPSSFGDGGFATSAKLFGTSDVAIHPTTGDIYLAESANLRIRKIVRSTGIITTLASPTGGQYTGLCFDSSGRLLVTVYDTNTLLRQTVSGGATFSAVSSTITLKGPRDVAVDSAGNIYVVSGLFNDSSPGLSSSRIIKITTGGVSSVYVGTDGTPGLGGDGGPPDGAAAKVDFGIDVFDVNVDPSVTENLITNQGIGFTSTGDMIFSDGRNYRVRRVK